MSTYMNSWAALLHTHVMTSTENLAIGAHQTGSNGYASLSSTLLRLLQCSSETCILFHVFVVFDDHCGTGFDGERRFKLLLFTEQILGCKP